jgi:hypothetical protein
MAKYTVDFKGLPNCSRMIDFGGEKREVSVIKGVFTTEDSDLADFVKKNNPFVDIIEVSKDERIKYLADRNAFLEAEVQQLRARIPAEKPPQAPGSEKEGKDKGRGK